MDGMWLDCSVIFWNCIVIFNRNMMPGQTTIFLEEILIGFEHQNTMFQTRGMLSLNPVVLVSKRGLVLDSSL